MCSLVLWGLCKNFDSVVVVYGWLVMVNVLVLFYWWYMLFRDVLVRMLV